MTAREWAEQVVRAEGFPGGGTLAESITGAIQWAITDEREACAVLVERAKPPGLCDWGDGSAPEEIAAAIRARGGGG